MAIRKSNAPTPKQLEQLNALVAGRLPPRHVLEDRLSGLEKRLGRQIELIYRAQSVVEVTRMLYEERDEDPTVGEPTYSSALRGGEEILQQVINDLEQMRPMITSVAI